MEIDLYEILINIKHLNMSERFKSSNSARKAFKSPFRSESPISSKELSNESKASDNESSNDKSKPDSFDTFSTPKRNIGFKRKLSCNSSGRKVFKTPFKSPLTKNNTDLINGDNNDLLNSLIEKEQLLDKQIEALENEGFKVEDLKTYIDQLHEYNEIKDAAQIVMGRIAEMDQVSFKEVHSRYNADSLD